TLYTYPENWRAFKALIAAQYSGAKIRVLSSPPHFHFGQTNKTPEFLRKFPVGKVPAFEGDDGFCVFESNAIAYYGDGARGGGGPSWQWGVPMLSILSVFLMEATEFAKEEVRRVLGVLDSHLRTQTFLVGERVSLADITVVCALLWLYKQVLEPAFRQPFGNVNRWFVTCLNQPQFKAVLGEVQLCEKMAQFDAKKFAEVQPRKEPPRKEKPPREEKRKEEKKEEKKPEPEEELDECEQALAAEPKAKDPFAHLPKSLFLPRFFLPPISSFPPVFPPFPLVFPFSLFSLFFPFSPFPFLLNFILLNFILLLCMFQRLDKLRKNAFASVILFGTNNDSSISGVWLFRGQELAFPLSPDWQVDYESYSWRKLDPESEECRTLVKEYFTWEGEFQHVGKPFNQGKIFK
ncbi:EF1G factor, partial [Probosciger aterrimus]|nr:EF1G factor [Probosciger aterrimus]